MRTTRANTEPPGRAARLASLTRPVCVLALVVAGLVLVSGPARGHGDDETGEGYLLVQQALGHLAHGSSDETVHLAMEKVDDALHADDQEGVDVAEVERAMGALEDGDVERARDLLQDSITEAVRDLPPATGNETGTTVVAPKLAGRSGVGGQGWGFLAASVVVLLVGAGLVRRFRPRDSVRELRRMLARGGVGEEESAAGEQGERGRS